MRNLFKRIATLFQNDGWRYDGSNSRMREHIWKNGDKRIKIYWMRGHSHHRGYVVEATKDSETTLRLSNGFVRTLREAMVLADMQMRDDCQRPMAFMHSDRIESEHGFEGTVRQDEWLSAHASDYEFRVIDPVEVSE